MASLNRRSFLGASLAAMVPNLALPSGWLDHYVAVIPRFNLPYIVGRELAALRDVVKSARGVDLKIIEDNTPATSKEIIIGKTTRTANREALDRDQYTISVRNGKIYLEGGHGDAIAAAIRKFTQIVKSGRVLTDGEHVEGNYSADIKGTNDYRLVLADEFDGETINKKIWRVLDGDEGKNAGFYGRTSYRRAKNCYVDDGKLHICGTKDETAYYGGMLCTDHSFSYRYGYAEISAKIPHGEAFWTAFWTRGAAANKYCAMEADIYECFGDSSRVAPNLHRWPTPYAKSTLGWQHTSLDREFGQTKKLPCPDGKLFNDDFHTYGMEWNERDVAFTCDGRVYFAYIFKDTPEDQYAFTESTPHFVLSMACGLALRQPKTNTKAPKENQQCWINSNKLIVEYFHLYQKPGQILKRATA
jgi:hypothetical protein